MRDRSDGSFRTIAICRDRRPRCALLIQDARVERFVASSEDVSGQPWRVEFTLAVRRQDTERLVARYRKAARAEKTAFLNELADLNGWHRDHVRKALRMAAVVPRPQRAPRTPILRYGPKVIEAGDSSDTAPPQFPWP